MRLVKPIRIVDLVAFLFTLIFVLSLQPIHAQAAPKQESFLDQLNSSLKDLAERVSPAVVEVKVSGYGVDDDSRNDEEDDDRRIVKQHLSGAGVILGSDGYIVTNAHLIEGAKRVQVI